MPRKVDITVQVHALSSGVVAATCELFASVIEQAVAARGVARIAISGGSTPKSVFALLADPAAPYLNRIPWTKLQLFWVDERAVGPEHADSNYGMTRAQMLDKVPLPPDQVHRMLGELDPQVAASRYESELRNAFRLEGAEAPVFDLILLGLGDDGHTASLFPHTEGLNELSALVIANHVPQKDTWRITLTWPVITQGRQVAFLIEGAAKAGMVQTVFAGRYDPETYPAQLIRPASGQLLLLLDAAAASELPGAVSEGTFTLEQA